jgi:hypothetical protein
MKQTIRDPRNMNNKNATKMKYVNEGAIAPKKGRADLAKSRLVNGCKVNLATESINTFGSASRFEEVPTPPIARVRCNAQQPTGDRNCLLSCNLLPTPKFLQENYTGVLTVRSVYTEALTAAYTGVASIYYRRIAPGCVPGALSLHAIVNWDSSLRQRLASFSFTACSFAGSEQHKAHALTLKNERRA